MTLLNRKNPSILFRLIVWLILVSFVTGLATPPKAYAQGIFVPGATGFALPAPGAMIAPTAAFVPPIIRGVKVFPQDPLRFDFILDTGDSTMEKTVVEQEATKLIKYFLAALTVPETDLWVNLSPYEKNRIIPESFGQTEMGRDLLAQDYILKQLTSSLMYPENELGKKFWDKIYARAYELYGTTDIPVNTFNKVWIVPDKAVVYENGDVAFVKTSHLKVMLESDYVTMSHQRDIVESLAPPRGVALRNNLNNDATGLNQMPAQKADEVNSVSSAIVREIIIPAIEKEVNEGENFAALRQIYHAMILATWFKQYLKESFLGKMYAQQNKIAGVDVTDKSVKEKIYAQYVEAFKTGVYNYIKDDYDPQTQEIVSRQYFSGGFDGPAIAKNLEREIVLEAAIAQAHADETRGDSLQVSVNLDPVRASSREDLSGSNLNIHNAVLHELLQRGKKNSPTWTIAAREFLAEIGGRAETINAQTLLLRANVLDHLGDKPNGLSSTAADNYGIKFKAEMQKLAREYFASLKEGEMPDLFALAMHLFDVVEEGRMPKSPQGRRLANGESSNGLGADRFFVYLPTLMYQIFRPMVEEEIARRKADAFGARVTQRQPLRTFKEAMAESGIYSPENGRGLVEAAMRRENLIGQGDYSWVFAIPGIDDYALRIKKIGNDSGVKHDYASFAADVQFEENPSEGIDAYTIAVAKISPDIAIIRKVPGKLLFPREITFSVEDDIANKNFPEFADQYDWRNEAQRTQLNSMYESMLERLASLPLESYVNYLRKLKQLMDSGIDFDEGGGNVLLSDSGEFYFVDVSVLKERTEVQDIDLGIAIWAITNPDYGNEYYFKSSQNHKKVNSLMRNILFKIMQANTINNSLQMPSQRIDDLFMTQITRAAGYALEWTPEESPRLLEKILRDQRQFFAATPDNAADNLPMQRPSSDPMMAVKKNKPDRNQQHAFSSLHLTTEKEYYMDQLQTMLTKPELTLNERNALAEALVRLTDEGFATRTRFIKDEEEGAIRAGVIFDPQMLLARLRVDRKLYLFQKNSKGQQIFKEKELATFLYRKLIPFEWYESLVNDRLQPSLAKVVALNWSNPLETWQTSMRPVRDQLIESGLSLRDANMAVINWGVGAKEKWDNSLLPMTKKLEERGLAPSHAVLAVVQWGEKALDTWTELESVRDDIHAAIENMPGLYDLNRPNDKKSYANSIVLRLGRQSKARWGRVLKPALNLLIEEGVNPPAALRFVLGWKNSVRTWHKTKGGFKDRLVKMGIKSERADYLVLKMDRIVQGELDRAESDRPIRPPAGGSDPMMSLKEPLPEAMEVSQTFTITGTNNLLHTRPYRLIYDAMTHQDWAEGIEIYVTEPNRAEELMAITGAMVGFSIAAYLPEGSQVRFRIVATDPDQRGDIQLMMKALEKIFTDRIYLAEDSHYPTKEEADSVVAAVRAEGGTRVAQAFKPEDFSFAKKNSIFAGVLTYKGKVVPYMTKGQINEVFDFGDYVVRVYKKKGKVHSYSNQRIELMNQLANIGLSPQVMSYGYTHNDPEEGHFFVVMQKVQGNNYARLETPLTQDSLDKLLVLLQKLIENQIYVADLKPENIMQGTIANEGSLEQRAFLVDFDEVTLRYKISAPILASIYLRQYNNFKDSYNWVIFDPDKKIGQFFQDIIEGKENVESAKPSDQSNKGGIDLNPAALSLSTEGSGIDRKPFDPAFPDLPAFDGFTPVIFQIIPTNMPLFLGLTDAETQPQLTIL